MYDHREEASRRLLNTVVMYEDVPFYVTDVDGTGPDDLRVYGRKLPRGTDQWVSITNPQLKWCNMRTGYMNYANLGSAFYLQRVPVRRGEQGLNNNNLRFFKTDNERRDDTPGRFPGFRDYYRSQGFTDMLTGVYPTVETAFTMLRSTERNITRVAFGRSFAVEKDEIGLFFLSYKGQKIGFTETGHDIRIAPQFKHLHEICVEHNIKVKGHA